MAEKGYIPEEFADAPEQEVFKGFTLNELKYQRALTAVKKEYAREKMLRSINGLRNRSAFGENKFSKFKNAGGFLSRALTGLNYADYAMLGFSLFSTGRKIYDFFKRRK